MSDGDPIAAANTLTIVNGSMGERMVSMDLRMDSIDEAIDSINHYLKPIEAGVQRQLQQYSDTITTLHTLSKYNRATYRILKINSAIIEKIFDKQKKQSEESCVAEPESIVNESRKAENTNADVNHTLNDVAKSPLKLNESINNQCDHAKCLEEVKESINSYKYIQYQIADSLDELKMRNTGCICKGLEELKVSIQDHDNNKLMEYENWIWRVLSLCSFGIGLYYFYRAKLRN